MGLRAQLAKLLRDTPQAGYVAYVDVAATDTTSIVNTANLTNTTLTLAGQPDMPRNVVITVVDTTPSITAGTVTVTGKGARGQTMVETFNCSAGAGTYTGNAAFATITSIVTSNFATLGGGGDETIAVGVGNKLGLPVFKLLSVFKASYDGSNETLGTVNLTYGTYVPTGALTGGTHDMYIWYTYYSVPESY